MGCLDRLRQGCQEVCRSSRHVFIQEEGLQRAAGQFTAGTIKALTSEKAFNAELHLVGKGGLTAQYILVLDALNFCFWPQPDLEYDNLAKGLKDSVLSDPEAISAKRLRQMDESEVLKVTGCPQLPLLSERARLLREVGEVLESHFEGKAENLVLKAKKSAEDLVGLVTSYFTGFQDYAICRGKQVLLYKRAQIFVGDIWGSFKGKGLGEFHDIHKLTMFADYRVPVVLRELGILEYSPALANKIQQLEEIPPGSEEEVEIRASSIIATECLRETLATNFDVKLHSVQLDWWLWEEGERQRKSHPPHHRTRTIFY